LVDLEERFITFDNYFDLKDYLAKILRKKKIDLIIKSSLEPRRGKYILEEAVYV
jgi:predicted nucleotidyltransferase